jgi:thymidylate kinase
MANRSPLDGGGNRTRAGGVPPRVRRASPGDPQERGAFVVIIGPDGVGKTTIARALIDAYKGPTAYFHFVPPVGRPLAPRPVLGGEVPSSKGEPTGSRILGWVRLLHKFVRIWVGYRLYIQPALRRGSLVVGDRWAYGYVVQPRALRFYGPRWLALCTLRALPRPDLVANLSAPPEVIRQRKRELSLEEIEGELVDWADLPALPMQTFDAVRAPEQIASDILDALRRRAAGREHTAG